MYPSRRHSSASADQSTPPMPRAAPAASHSRMIDPRQSTQVPNTSKTRARTESLSTIGFYQPPSTSHIFHPMEPRQRSYLDALRERVLVFDGSMGANLQELAPTAEDFGGAAYEGCMDALCVTQPALPARLHRGFL